MAQPSSGKVRIFLHARFRVEDGAGQEITPAAIKVQALLALLATEPKYTRGRAWLQDHLWSNSSAAKAQGSLRQALSRLRDVAEPLARAIRADRHQVSLISKFIEISTEKSGEFLEGMDIGDPEFEEWLRLMRSHAHGSDDYSQQLPSRSTVLRNTRNSLRPSDARVLVIRTGSLANTTLNAMENNLADGICKTIREFTDFVVRRDDAGHVDADGVLLQLQAFTAPDDQLAFRVSVTDLGYAATPWVESVSAPFPREGITLNPGHLTLCHRAAMALLEMLQRQTPSDEANANIIASNAFRMMFSMQYDALAEADRLFRLACEIAPRGLFQAWRAQLEVIRFIESGGHDRQEVYERTDALCAAAMALEPTNSNVLAAIANTRLVMENDLAGSGELSRLSVLTNPSNPLAWWSWSNALLYSNQAERAHAAASHADILAQNGPLRFWTDFQVALTAAVTNRPERAIRYAERSRALCPAFRPPLRYLVGIQSSQGKHDEARQSVVRLQRVEPDFSVDRLIHDDTYPVSMMRRAGLVKAQQLRDL